jgi:threonine/homoserine/homoserine lactone efflux protein
LILAFIVGLFLAFAGSMPIAGPIAVVIVSKGLENKARAGICIAAGAAVAESAYAFMAFWGLTSVLNRFPVVLRASRLFGCALLIALGVYFILRKRKESAPPKDQAERAGFQNVLFGLSVTAANPTLIVTWTAAVSAAHSMGILRVRALDAFPFAGGVAVGIVAWFVILLWLLSRFRSRVNPSTIDRVIRTMGVLLVLLGLAFAVRVIVGWHRIS